MNRGEKQLCFVSVKASISFTDPISQNEPMLDGSSKVKGAIPPKQNTIRAALNELVSTHIVSILVANNLSPGNTVPSFKQSGHSTTLDPIRKRVNQQSIFPRPTMNHEGHTRIQSFHSNVGGPHQRRSTMAFEVLYTGGEKHSSLRLQTKFLGRQAPGPPMIS